MTAIGESLKNQRQRRFKWSIFLAMGLLALTLLAGLWLAISTSAPTTIQRETETGRLVVTGPESKFVGRVDGRVADSEVSVIGLPSYADIAEDGEALRAICALRSDPSAQWSDDSDTLRAHLNSPELDRLCMTAS